MLIFNEAISNLGIVEIPLSGNKCTWSNKQENPLLVRLGWFFTSGSQLSSYPGTKAYTLSTDTSDHIPCVISIETSIPKAQIFRFGNYWMEHGDFLQIVQHAWAIPVTQQDNAKKLVANSKNLRRVLRTWLAQISYLKKFCCQC